MSDCPFCPIPPDATVVADWGDIVAFVPLNPVTPGHVLIVPRAHVADVAEDPQMSAQVMFFAADVASRFASCNIITSRGAPATQTVRHLHLHVVPRVEGDGLHLPWTGQHID